MLRVGDIEGAHYYRAERFFTVNLDWYFSTREQGVQGPHPSRFEAERALTNYVRAALPIGEGAGDVPNTTTRALEQGYAALAELEILSAWEHLTAASTELGMPIENVGADIFSRCNSVLCAAEAMYQRDSSKLMGLSRQIRDYSHCASVLPFPLSGMLVPERLYLKLPTKNEAFCCKVSNVGSVLVADSEGNLLEEGQAGIPLDARVAVTMLIGKMRGTIS